MSLSVKLTQTHFISDWQTEHLRDEAEFPDPEAAAPLRQCHQQGHLHLHAEVDWGTPVFLHLSPCLPVFRISIQMLRIRILVNLRTNLIHSLQVKNFQFFYFFIPKKYLADVYLLALRTRIAFKTSSFSRLRHSLFKITFY